MIDESTIRRFWSKVDRRSAHECWVWTGPVDRKGYGWFTYHGRKVRAHRMAIEIAVGKIPPGLFGLHRCDNPPCCNPAHLFTGSHQDNMADAQSKGRMKGWPGPHPESAHVRKIDRETAGVIRARYMAGETQQQIADGLGLDQRTISHIVRNRRWPDPTYVPPPRRRNSRSCNSRHANVSPVSVAAATKE